MRLHLREQTVGPAPTPFKPCKRGHISERHVIKGCNQCRRELGKRADAARILNGKWAESLEAAIETARASQDFGLYPVTALVPSSHLALVIAHFVTRPRLNKKAPSVLTVAEELGRALSVPKDLWRHDGAMLLGVAEACGFILPLDNQQRINGRYLQSEVRLSPEAYRQRADIEERLAGEDIDSESRPVPDVPAVQVTIRPNIKASEPEAPLPEPIESVAAALAPIQSTAWRVNPFMYRTLREWVALQVSLDIEESRHTGALAALEQAGYWSQLPRFYYRCRFDWRGRLYQLGGSMQYTSGADAARALLEFADGEPLTAEGRNWLAVHVATCYGLKGSYAERIAWTEKHSEGILATVRDPVASWSRWGRAKEPYQFLAACDAWRQYTDNPDAPIHLPVAADATSSILQHYAWLMRDTELGARVNLIGAPIGATARDFYGELARYTRTVLVTKADGTFDTERVKVPLSRDQVKQAIWFFYGQTFDSLAEELGTEQFARQMRAHLRRHASGAWKLRERLRTVARRFAASGLPIAWTLPDGFRVYQAYRQSKTMMAPIPLWSWKGVWYLKPRARRLLAAFSRKNQVNGLPANLIHSFDACLLREIVRQAPTVTRWAVAHDCVGVHPNDRTAMHDAALRAIAWLYGSDRLAELWQQWGAIAGRRLRHPDVLPAQMGGSWYTFS